MAAHAPSAQERRYAFWVTISGRHQYAATGPVIRDRALKTFQLVYLERGRGWFESGAYRANLTPGTCAVLFPGVPHSFGPAGDDPLEIVWITLQGDALWEMLAGAGATPERPCVDAAGAPEPRAVFRELLAARGPYVWRVQALVWSFLARMAVASGGSGPFEPAGAATTGARGSQERAASAGRPPEAWDELSSCDDPAIARALELARLHLAEPGLRVEHLARAAALSRSSFMERFRAAVGTSPMRYLEERRLRETRHLLAETELPVASVARASGFADPLYFSRRFRSATGQSPSAYRAVAQGASS